MRKRETCLCLSSSSGQTGPREKKKLTASGSGKHQRCQPDPTEQSRIHQTDQTPQASEESWAGGKSAAQERHWQQRAS